MNALESIAAYLLPRRQRERSASSVEKALAATDDLIHRMRDAFQPERDVLQKPSIESRHRL